MNINAQANGRIFCLEDFNFRMDYDVAVPGFIFVCSGPTERYTLQIEDRGYYSCHTGFQKSLHYWCITCSSNTPVPQLSDLTNNAACQCTKELGSNRHRSQDMHHLAHSHPCIVCGMRSYHSASAMQEPQSQKRDTHKFSHGGGGVPASPLEFMLKTGCKVSTGVNLLLNFIFFYDFNIFL